MANLSKIAAVFDAMADYIEEQELSKLAAIESARRARIDKIASTHVATHGEEMPDVVRNKLSQADDASLDVVEELLAKQAGVVAPLGAGMTSDADHQPRTTKEAADAADDRFVSWIVS